jgi:DNA modification methylase
MAFDQHNPARGRLNQDLKRKAQRQRGSQTRAHEAEKRTANAPRRNDLMPALELVQMPVDELKPPARAVRKLDAAHVTEVAAAIGALGYCDPIIINPEGLILDGVTRHAAAKALKLATVACIVLHHLTPATERAARIALNRLGEKGTWDVETLKIEIEELIDLDTPIEILGFEVPELDLILSEGESDEGEDQEPPIPPPASVAISAVGDAWMADEHRVLCGDSTDPEAYEALMGDRQARLVLTDVPYNVAIQGHVSGLGRHRHREFAQASGEMSPEQFLAFLVTVMQLAAARVVDGGLFISSIDWRSVRAMLAAGVINQLELINLVVWAKTNGGMGSLWRSAHELLPVLKVGRAPHVNNVALGKHGRWRSNVWNYAGGSSLGSDARDGLADHPTPKPVALLEDAILDVTHRGEIVLDPFLGSGSTLIAAERSGRTCHGIELDPLYVDVTLRRWAAITGRQPVLVETGETFAQVEARRNMHAARAALPAPVQVERG